MGEGYSGGSLCAAGWTYVGESAGRGRRAGTGERVPPKAVWLRPLTSGWRRAFGVVGAPPDPPPRRRSVLGPGDGLDRDRWAGNEFGGAALHGKLRDRLVASAAVQAAAPSKTFFTAACGNQALVTGYYRMIRKADHEHVGLTPEGILAGHRDRTVRRMRGAGTVLLIQDGTDLNFATHPGCDGLGVIARNGRKGSGTLGIHMHSTFAVSERGIPLGVPRIEFDCPEGGGERGKPPEERKSGRWLRGWRDSSLLAGEANAVKGRAGGISVVSVMDREGDIAALFVEHRDRGGADLLVRARADRVLADGGRLFEEVRASTSPSRHEICVDRASARRAARGQKAFAGREARRAAVELRWLELSVPVPRQERRRLGSEPVRLTAVHGPRALSAVRHGGPRMAVADDAAGRQRGRGAPDPRPVRPEVAHRGLAPDPEDRLRDREVGLPNRRADEGGRDDQRGDRLASGGADAHGPGHPGTARPQDVLGLRDRDAARLRDRRRLPGSRPGAAGGSGGPRSCIAWTGLASRRPARRLPEPEQRRPAGPSDGLGGIRQARHRRADHRADRRERRGKRAASLSRSERRNVRTRRRPQPQALNRCRTALRNRKRCGVRRRAWSGTSPESRRCLVAK